MIIGSYYPEWNVYSRKYYPSDIPVDKLTHLFYAFARPSETGSLVFSDVFHKNIFKKIRSNDCINGLCAELFELKKKNRHLKLILSIGGGNGSKFFGQVCCDNNKRSILVNEISFCITNLGFDGVDIDWEHPHDENESLAFVSLLKEVRTRFDKICVEQKIEKLYLSAAINPLPYYVKTVKPERFCEYLDFIVLMCYDFSGPWSKRTKHQSNLHSSESFPKSVCNSIDDLIQRGIPSTKLLLGCPLYGRAFANSEGLDTSFEGACKGTWEDNVFDYNAISEINEKFDEEHCATYSFDPVTKIFITYDCPQSISKKTEYVKETKLGGMITWSINADHKSGHPRSIHDKMYNDLADKLDSCENNLKYPTSRFSNIRL